MASITGTVKWYDQRNMDLFLVMMEKMFSLHSSQIKEKGPEKKIYTKVKVYPLIYKKAKKVLWQ